MMVRELGVGREWELRGFDPGLYRLVAGFLQNLHCFFDPVILDQNVVGVEGRDGEDGNRTIGKRLNERSKNACLRKRKWSFQLEASPVILVLNVSRNLRGEADDRYLVSSTSNRKEFALRGPRRDGRCCR